MPTRFSPRPALPLVAALLFLGARGLPAAAEPAALPLWPGIPPGSEGRQEPEVVDRSASGERKIWSIHRPSLLPYLPAAGQGTGAAVIIAPGGAHRFLCVDHEGVNVAAWLQQRGVAAFVLKNRLAKETNSTYRIEGEALADMQRAVRLVRSRAAEWGVVPSRVGVMGFSAGGELAALACARFDAGQPEAADPVNRQGCRPDFQALIYPGRSGDIQPAAGAPPVFLACGYKDRTDISEGLAELYLRYKRANVPAELHIYAGAGHGFGLRAGMPEPVAGWPARFLEFLGDRGFLRPQ
jgi:endo-1,4-beta-xylanase